MSLCQTPRALASYIALAGLTASLRSLSVTFRLIPTDQIKDECAGALVLRLAVHLLWPAQRAGKILL